jgi:hypothetical protein
MEPSLCVAVHDRLSDGLVRPVPRGDHALLLFLAILGLRAAGGVSADPVWSGSRHGRSGGGASTSHGGSPRPVGEGVAPSPGAISHGVAQEEGTKGGSTR